GCPFCRREISLIKRLDSRGAIKFVNVVSEQSECPIDRAELLTKFHASEDGGPLLSGAAAFAAMWRSIPLLRPFGLLAQRGPALWLLDRLYVVFLRARPALQKLAR
ncbi:MAG: DUF393 domain-containing protein, partial [Alphaproteobacteria bacterium]